MKVIWKKSDEYEPYVASVSYMESIVEEIVNGADKQTIWFLEHKDVYTAGTSADSGSLLDKKKFDVYKTGRGGGLYISRSRSEGCLFDARLEKNFCTLRSRFERLYKKVRAGDNQ